jgi:hypothetical protein
VAKQKTSDRKAIAEKLRREQQRKERQRSLMILGACALVVVGLLAAAVIPYVNHQRDLDRIKGTAIAKIGVPATAAACSPIKTKSAEGSGQHINPPQVIRYPDAPPAFGKHWGNFLTGSEIKNFYSRSDRPEIERLVHSLEHGHTILWYDDTVKPGTAAYDQVKQIADKFSADDYFMSAPYETKLDGGTFPSGKHIALTHWTGPDKQTGVWEYCGKPSGEVVKDFTTKYTKDNAPEPGAA